MKDFYKSKRFWSGVIAFLTALSLVFTGEKTLEATLPELILALLTVVQTFLGLTSNDQVKVGNRVL